jgi:hypothetical protein
MWNALVRFFSFISGLYLLYIAFLFIKWYIKMHFHPKWFWVFWIYTFIVIYMYAGQASSYTSMHGDFYIQKRY